jgi:hypothetical protein
MRPNLPMSVFTGMSLGKIELFVIALLSVACVRNLSVLCLSLLGFGIACLCNSLLYFLVVLFLVVGGVVTCVELAL